MVFVIITLVNVMITFTTTIASIIVVMIMVMRLMMPIFTLINAIIMCTAFLIELGSLADTLEISGSNSTDAVDTVTMTMMILMLP